MDPEQRTHHPPGRRTAGWAHGVLHKGRRGSKLRGPGVQTRRGRLQLPGVSRLPGLVLSPLSPGGRPIDGEPRVPGGGAVTPQ